jgi:VWFA-related protein
MAATSADAPLTTDDVLRFLRAGISERTILVELAGRGFAEAIDEPREAALRAAGAGETLIVALRRAAAAPPVPRASAPPSAGVAAAASAASSAALPSFGADTRTVRVPVSVLDKSGRPVLGLQAHDFRISDDGRRQQVTLFSGERRALRLALALDVSASMSNKIRQVEAALRYFTDLLEPVDEILVITFNSHVKVLQDFTSDRERLGRVLDQLEPTGPTALFDAAAEAIRRVSSGAAETKAVVLVTDGVDTESRTSFESLRELARRSEAPVFSIGIDAAREDGALRVPKRGSSGERPRTPRGGPRRPPIGWPGNWPGGPGSGPGGGPGGFYPPASARLPTPAEFDARPLLDLAEDTGARAEIVKGAVHYAPGSDGPGSERLRAAVESIAMTLRHRYLLGYEPPEGRPGWRTIRVEVERGSVNARARKGYYAGV